jgi:ribosomal protein L17
MEHKEIRRLIFDVYTELEVEPVNDKDFEFVGKGVIETVIRRSKEVKEMADLFINYARQQDAE